LFVTADTRIDDLADRLLPELAELSAAVARKLAARIDKAKYDAAAAALGHAFERTCRSVRMCLAFGARLAAERRRTAREDADLGRERLEHRRKQIRIAVGRAIDETAEPGTAVRLTNALRERLEEEKLFETFADGPIERHIARIRRALGLPPEALSAEDEADAPAAPPLPPPIPANAGAQAEPQPTPGLQRATDTAQPP
jgi:hypothetical protein